MSTSALQIAVSAAKTLLAGAAAIQFLVTGASASPHLSAVASTLASVSGTVFGFLLTALAILVALPDSTLLSNLKANGGYKHLVKRVHEACVALFVVLLSSVMAVFLDDGLAQNLVAAAVFFSVWAIIASIDAGMKFARIVDNL